MGINQPVYLDWNLSFPINLFNHDGWYKTAFRPVSITYVDPDGEETTVDAAVGENLLEVAHATNIDT